MPTLDEHLEEMKTRAQRQLDGMTVSKERVAKDVLTLIELVKVSQATVVSLMAERRKKEDPYSEWPFGNDSPFGRGPL